MALIYLSLITVIPAMLILWVGIWLGNKFSAESNRQGWLLFLLLVAIALLSLGSFYADRFRDGNFPLILLFLFPAYEGVLALLLIAWREIVALWRRRKTLLSILLLALLTLLVSLARYPGTGMALAVIILPALFAAMVWGAVSRLSERMLFLGAIIGMIYLFLDATGLFANQAVMTTRGLLITYQATKVVVSVIAIAISVILVHHSASEGHKYALIPAALLVIGLAVVEVRHGLLVDATGRAAEDHFPFGSLLLGVVAGMLLAGLTEGRSRWMGFGYMLVVPALIVTAYLSGMLFDPQAITENRAGRIAQAVESYQVENGSYPRDLDELAPKQLPILLGPLNGRGRAWCYQGGADYYRLGYVFFQRYYEATYPTPYYEIKLLYSAGELPPGRWLCDDELSRYKESPGL